IHEGIRTVRYVAIRSTSYALVMVERAATMSDLLNGAIEIPDHGPTEAVPAVRVRRRKPMKKAKPTPYRVICISMYTRDLDELDAKVSELKRRSGGGFRMHYPAHQSVA